MELLEAAAETTELFLQVELRNRPRPSGPSLSHCEECEEEIPDDRRKAQPGCTHCVSCAEIIQRTKAWRR